MIARGPLSPCLEYPNTTQQIAYMQHVDVFCVQGLQKLLHHTAADIDSKQVAIPKNLNIYYSEIQGYQ